MRILSVLAIGGLAIGLSSTDVMAVSSTVTATIAFDTALTLSPVSQINFGTVKALVADTYTIDTAGTVTAAGSGQWLHGPTSAGNISIAGSTTQTINISVGNYSAASNGVTAANAKCRYNGDTESACSRTGAAAPAAGKTLLLGVQAVVSGTQAAGSPAATPTFDVTVVYN
jgi:hypothetical protein